MSLAYQSGEEIRGGDRISYAGELGSVEFVVVERVGNPAMDWYLEQFPQGGFMLRVPSFGSLFLPESDEDLEFISRGDAGIDPQK